MKVYKYNSEKLVFESTDVLFKYKITISCLLLLITFLLSSFINEKIRTSDLKETVTKKEQMLALKQARIEEIKQPIREETYVEDLYKNIGFKLTPQQYERFSYLATKYRNDIEKAHVPATLVWWVAFKESGFNVNAENSQSTAKGMFQFLNGTWNTMCKMKATDKGGRFNEEKQVQIMLVYLNYLYNKYGSWAKSMNEYHGGEYQYPVKFLFK